MAKWDRNGPKRPRADERKERKQAKQDFKQTVLAEQKLFENSDEDKLNKPNFRRFKYKLTAKERERESKRESKS